MGEINDFEDVEFYGFASISYREKRKFEKNYRKIEANHYTISTYGDTEEWKGANAKLEEKSKN